MKNYYKYNPWQEKFDRVCKNWEKMNEQTLANKEKEKTENKEKANNN